MTEFIEDGRNWEEQVVRMNSGMMPKKSYRIRTQGKGSLGSSVKEWKDSLL
jgi:hypothetical protein